MGFLIQSQFQTQCWHCLSHIFIGQGIRQPQYHLALFISHLHRAGYSPATVSSHISAIGYIHKSQGGSDPITTFLVQKLLSACHKLSKQFDLRMPIDKPMLSRLLGALDFTVSGTFLRHFTVSGKHHRALYEAMFCLAFYAFLRIGEMTVQSANATNSNFVAVETARNQRHNLTAGLPSSNHDGILLHARCYSRYFISVLPRRACHARQV